MTEQTKISSEVTAFLKSPQKLLINGKWQEAQSGKLFDVENPANGDILTQVAHGDKDDIGNAVTAARKAFNGGEWATMKASDRSKILWKVG